jgi:transcriptional regulator with XRE-family HTH domain
VRRVIAIDTEEKKTLEHLGRRLRLARLRRNLSQEDMAERAGVTRKTYAALEAGETTSSLALLARALTILGYTDRLSDLLATDPIGEDTEDFGGRKRAGRRDDVADF